jgi:hypothetical protein
LLPVPDNPILVFPTWETNTINMQPLPSPEEINARRMDLLQKIAIGKQAEKELEELDASLKKLAGMFAPKIDPSKDDLPTSVTPRLTDLAEEILRSFQKLYIEDLLYQLRQRGWGGSGNLALDKKNLYNTLAGSKRFTNAGRNYWMLTKEEEKEIDAEEHRDDW